MPRSRISGIAAASSWRAVASRIAVSAVGCGHLADSPESLYGQRVQKLELAVRRHDQQAVRFGHHARNLGQELRPRHAHGDRQADLGEHALTQPTADELRRADDLAQAAHVQERLVDRQALDEGCGVAEDLEDRLARRRVRGHPRRHDDRTGQRRPIAVRTPKALAS